jgi:hypothetical protein
VKTTKAKAAAALDAILSGINEAGGSNTPGRVRVYTGSAPADLATGATGTLLVDAPLIDGSHAAFGATDTSTLVATGYTSGSKFAEDTSADNTGTAGYFRVRDYSGNDRLQGSVGTSAAELILNTLSVTAGVDVVISSCTVSISGLT